MTAKPASQPPMNSQSDKKSYLVPVTDPRTLQPGVVLRRIGGGKDQQGQLVEVREGGLVVAEVVDLNTPAFVAEAGLLTLNAGDLLFAHSDSFKTSSRADQARKTIEEWILFRDTPDLQEAMIKFVEKAYSPSQILDFARNDLMKNVFIPIQQKFKIGRFAEKVNPRVLRVERFRTMLESLADGKHLTYLAFIPGEQITEPMFYSAGTQPHRETVKQLEREIFSFRPNTGGHIKIISPRDEPRRFIVDAGSNELGVGVRTPLSEAEKVADALTELFPEWEFIAVPGRDAYGVQQSY